MKSDSSRLPYNRVFREYVRTFGGSLILCGLMISGFTVLVDPYAILRLAELENFNIAKPRMYNNARMVKAHYAATAKPRGVIMGSSRADVGLDAAAADSLGVAAPVFNSSLPSARIREVYAYIKHAHGEGDLGQAVVGLDFFMFDANAPYEPGFEMSRLALNPAGSVWLERAKDYLRAFFSYDAVSAAFDTLSQQKRYAVSYLDNGGQDPRSRQRNVTEKGGHREAFKAALRETVTSNDAIAALRYAPSATEHNGELAALREMVRFCQSEDIDLYLAISPVHALWLQAIWELGIWPDHERWKRDVTAVIDEAREERVSDAAIELWDFSGFSEINKEEVPAEGHTDAAMRWYWEASHYKHDTGSMLLSRLMGHQAEGIHESFGVRLSGENINDHLATLRRERESYVHEHPQATQLVREVLNDVRDLVHDVAAAER